MPAVTGDPLLGQVLDGRYVLVERLGAGGMGVVYKAHHRYTGELVAVKLLPADVRGAAGEHEIRRRFLREPRLQLLARHPNVLRVIDAGTAGAQSYLVTEYVDGEDLEQRLADRGRLGLAETFAILRQAAAALDAAHGRGIVHRDVKPANVLIRGDGHVFLTDFGVAKDPASADRTAMFVGTMNYASPEQIVVDGAVDGRADVYSLGCVMFHCLAGYPPFRVGSLYELMNAHVVQPPPLLSRERPGTPPGLDAVLRRALAKRRDERHASCLELVAEAAAAGGIDLATAASAPAPRTAQARTITLDVAPPPATRPFPTQPLTRRPRVRSRPHWSARLALGLLAVVAAFLASERVDGLSSERSDAGATAPRHAHTRGGTGTASGFTGYAAQLAAHFPDQISSARCQVASDDHADALVQIRCPADDARIDTYYELWPDQATMNRLLDENSSGLNVYFTGTWIDDGGTPRGRIDRFFTGLFNPRNVILWSYRALNATIWAESALSEDELYSWWRRSAPSAA